MRDRTCMELLKLIALDAEDLAVVSAHLQDAVLTVGEMAYLPHQLRFAAITSRFDWAGALGQDDKPSACQRRQTALRFERVLDAKVRGFDLNSKSQALCLLAIQFEPTSPPEGYVDLVFAGDAGLRLHVECIEAELKDLGAAWRARTTPRHPVGGPAGSQ